MLKIFSRFKDMDKHTEIGNAMRMLEADNRRLYEEFGVKSYVIREDSIGIYSKYCEGDIDYNGEIDGQFAKRVYKWLEQRKKWHMRAKACREAFYPYVYYHISIHTSLSKCEIHIVSDEEDENGFYRTLLGKSDVKSTTYDLPIQTITTRRFVRYADQMREWNAATKETEWGEIFVPPPLAQRLEE